MVKIKLCDRNITFGNNPRRLWICGSTQILMSSCRMWTSRLLLIPFPPPPSPKNFLHTVDVKLGISTLYQGSCIEELDKLETIPLRVLVSYAYLVFSHLPRVYMRLCKHGNHFTFLIVFSQSVSGRYSSNRAIWFAPGVDSILPSGPLTAGGIRSVARWVA